MVGTLRITQKVRRERKLPDQYLVLQDGCCQKISFQRNEPMLESTADSHVIAGTPLKHHVKTFENGCFRRESDAYELGLLFDVHLAIGGSTCSEKQRGHICCLDVAGTSRAEVTDQNFEEDNLGNKSKVKRLKTSSDDASNDYQVVCLGTSMEQRFRGALIHHLRLKDGMNCHQKIWSTVSF